MNIEFTKMCKIISMPCKGTACPTILPAIFGSLKDARSHFNGDGSAASAAEIQCQNAAIAYQAAIADLSIRDDGVKAQAAFSAAVKSVSLAIGEEVCIENDLATWR